MSKKILGEVQNSSSALNPAKLSLHTMNNEGFKEMMEHQAQDILDSAEEQLNSIIDSFPDDILNMPFSQLVESMKIVDNQNVNISNGDATTSNFKVPQCPVVTNKGKANSTFSKSKSVHWQNDSSLKPRDDIEIMSQINTNSFRQTPKRSHKGTYAVVTPGPQMHKKVRIMRVPKEGETAVSLSGSPLLVTPFAPVKQNQGTLIMSGENGETLAILKPPAGVNSPGSDSQLSDLEEDTKKKIQEFASYLLKSIGKDSNLTSD